jgi:PAS domain S-box-containing protein
LPISADFDFSRTFEPSPNASIVLDLENRIVAANRAYLDLLDTTWSRLEGKSVFDVLSIADEAALRASFERVRTTGHRDELPFIAYTDERHFSTTNSPISDDDGRVGWILHQVADVTSLHHNPDGIPQLGTGILSRAGQTSNELAILRQLFDQAPGFVTFLRGPAHRFELANPAYLELLGKTRAIIGKTVLEAVPEVANQGFIELLDGVYKTGVAYVGRGVEIMLVRTPGAAPEQRILDFVYQPIALDGQTIGIFVQGVDITDARAAEQEVARLARRYEQLIQIAPQQVWTARPDGRLDSVNEQTVRYFGKSQEAILGDGWQAVVHPDDLPETVALWVKSLQTGAPYQLNFRLRDANEVYRWHLARATAIRSADGAITQWIGTNTDIDEAYRDHEELLARAAYEEKLIGIVSHDLRNPLGTIALAVPLLERDDLTASQKKAIGYIQAAASRSERLIADLLDFAQARSGRFPIHPGPTDIAALVRAAVENARLHAGPRAVMIDHSGPSVGRWDEGRLTQVIANLVGNAFQHAPTTALIRVRSTIAGATTTIEVFNEGPAIAVEDQPRLFDPFARGKNARTKQGRSVGLGLYIAHQIAVAHGGTIDVKSIEGVGTTFTVRLPTTTPSAQP